MLTADLVRARRSGKELKLSPLRGAVRKAALELAESYLALTREHIGRSRGELRRAVAEVPCKATHRKLAAGLYKLIDDVCEWQSGARSEAPELREAVFRRAAARRAELPDGADFDRRAVLREVAAELEADPAQLEQGLYADLREEQRLLGCEPLSAERLLERYQLGQLQALLLRSVNVVAEIRCKRPAQYRTLFRRLKFRQLLYRISPLEEGGYRVEIDGPYSLFESVTKYGLQLALLLPTLLECDRYRIEAELRWGRTRGALHFELEGRNRSAASGQERLSDELEALRREFERRGSPWRPLACEQLLELEGVGLCVPDLVFEHAENGARVYFEQLGYWSRDAVWRRVELVRKGLSEPIVFAVSKRLRVSEQVLEEDASGALYVYARSMSAAQIEKRLDRLARNAGKSRRGS